MIFFLFVSSGGYTAFLGRFFSQREPGPPFVDVTFLMFRFSLCERPAKALFFFRGVWFLASRYLSLPFCFLSTNWLRPGVISPFRSQKRSNFFAPCHRRNRFFFFWCRFSQPLPMGCSLPFCLRILTFFPHTSARASSIRAWPFFLRWSAEGICGKEPSLFFFDRPTSACFCKPRSAGLRPQSFSHPLKLF